jgi:hypothetical protein
MSPCRYQGPEAVVKTLALMGGIRVLSLDRRPAFDGKQVLFAQRPRRESGELSGRANDAMTPRNAHRIDELSPLNWNIDRHQKAAA